MDTGVLPMKHGTIHNSGIIPYNQAVRNFEFNDDDDVNREFQVPRIH